MNRPCVSHPACHLEGGQIGGVIRFVDRVGPGKAWAVITAELRQIYHVQGSTTISVTAHDDDVPDLSEFTLDADQVIHFGENVQAIDNTLDPDQLKD